jgi:hypothetical protein
MIGRIFWWTALLAVATLTTALQIDKQAEASPSYATLVPVPMRNFAQTQIAARAAAGDDSGRALAETRVLVARRPVPAEYLALLAVAQAKAGQGEQSGLTIQIAGQRGWREPLTQEAVLRIALNAGDKAEAARRYVALFLRTETPDALLIELGPQVFDAPGGNHAGRYRRRWPAVAQSIPAARRGGDAASGIQRCYDGHDGTRCVVRL